MEEGESYRAIAKLYHIPRSTIVNRVQRAKLQRESKSRIALTEMEENHIIEFVLRCADKIVPLNRRNLQEAASIVIETLSEDRKCMPPFKNGNPGACWVRLFYARHKKDP